MWPFKKRRPSPEETLNLLCHALLKAEKETTREKTRLERRQAKLMTGIKKALKQKNLVAVKVLTSDLERTRLFATKFALIGSNIQDICLDIEEMRTNQAMLRAKKEASLAVRTFNFSRGSLRDDYEHDEDRREANSLRPSDKVLDLARSRTSDMIDARMIRIRAKLDRMKEA